MLFTQGQEIPRSLLVSHSGSKCNYTLHIVVYCHFENLVVCKILCVITTPAVKEGMYHACYFTRCTTIMQQNFSIQKIPLCDKGMQSLEAEIDCFFGLLLPWIPQESKELTLT